MAIYCFIIIGLVYVLTKSVIFKRTRFFLELISPKFFGELINCPMCTSFWVGIVLHLLGVTPLEYQSGILHNIFNAVICGCFSVGVIFASFTIIDYFEQKATYFNMKSNAMLQKLSEKTLLND